VELGGPYELLEGKDSWFGQLYQSSGVGKRIGIAEVNSTFSNPNYGFNNECVR
jgi:hypothetical protein